MTRIISWRKVTQYKFTSIIDGFPETNPHIWDLQMEDLFVFQESHKRITYIQSHNMNDCTIVLFRSVHSVTAGRMMSSHKYYK